MPKKTHILTEKNVGDLVRVLQSLEPDYLKPALYRIAEYHKKNGAAVVMLDPIPGSGSVASFQSFDGVLDPSRTFPQFLLLTREEASAYLGECARALQIVTHYLIAQLRESQVTAHECLMASMEISNEPTA